jgi:hypothetical protein
MNHHEGDEGRALHGNLGGAHDDRCGTLRGFVKLSGRICERLKIPRPPRGYWQRLAVGKADLQEPLPELDPGDEFEWNRGQGFDYPPPPDPQFTAIVKCGTRREVRPKTHPIVVDFHELWTPRE